MQASQDRSQKQDLTFIYSISGICECERDTLLLPGGLIHVVFAGDGVTGIKHHNDGINSNTVMQAFGEAAGADFKLCSFVVGKVSIYGVLGQRQEVLRQPTNDKKRRAVITQ